MVQYFEFRFVMTLLLLLLTLVGCSGGAENAHVGLGILVDVSDGCENRKLISKNGLNEVLGIHDPSTFAPSVLALSSEITGANMRPVRTFRLEAKSSLENPSTREKAVSEFANSLFEDVQNTSGNCNPTEYSSIYKPLKKMTERLLDDSTFSRRVLVVATDGMENHSISFLKDGDFIKSPEKMIEKLEKAHGEFPPMGNFEVILAHQPSETDLLGSKGVEFWKALFESKGATVQLQASL